MTVAVGLVVAALCLSAAMAVACAVALYTARSGWIDAIWSFAVGLASACLALWPAPDGTIVLRQALVAALALSWSLRLGVHIARRTVGGGDDPRYSHLRQEWGLAYRGRLFWFLQIQAVVAFMLAISVMIAAHNPAPGLRLSDCAGIALLLIALIGEAIADRQLQAFRVAASNRDKVCDAGLWGLSRHPNYFFESLAWCAYVLFAVDFSGEYMIGWLSLAAPTLMYWLLVHVSGVPPLEAHMLRSRGAAFRDYQQRVNVFWPGPQKPGAGDRLRGVP